MTTTVEEVIAALAARKNVLLSGPPGTGKTHLISQLVAKLSKPTSAGGRPALRVGSASNPLTSSAANDASSALPVPIEIDWVTFHQGYSYEDFIIGKRPVPSNGGVEIKPFLGLLTSIAIEVASSPEPRGHLIIIDEISRANASQVFGEFITLLDVGYRDTIRGTKNPAAVSVKLPGVSYKDGVSEPLISQRRTAAIELPAEWKFPEHIYVLATMNAVDKAALPLDSALTRRFHRINMAPDIEMLVTGLGMSMEQYRKIVVEARSPGADNSLLTAESTAVMLLDRINAAIAADLGEDFEIGHGMLWPVVTAKPEDRWKVLIETWDFVLKPQLMDRFVARHDALKELLYIDGQGDNGSVFTERVAIGASPVEGAAVSLPDLTRVPIEAAKATLKHIAG
jgi:hypothetical protein